MLVVDLLVHDLVPLLAPGSVDLSTEGSRFQEERFSLVSFAMSGSCACHYSLLHQSFPAMLKELEPWLLVNMSIGNSSSSPRLPGLDSNGLFSWLLLIVGAV
ncbi:hypothetical protein F2Q69_00023982 [Brassica cretica]|uniref:Uncharacterized protein n=1 Tax=Brassica cretica TaxID=69181 RepID=A0A8S9Q9D7_BRACR|nr:hypothetical protein F2Q69_00023982 [Brassica cretica]